MNELMGAVAGVILIAVVGYGGMELYRYQPELFAAGVTVMAFLALRGAIAGLNARKEGE